MLQTSYLQHAGMLIVLHTTLPFSMMLCKGLIHYYCSYATGLQNSYNSNGITSYKLQFEHWIKQKNSLPCGYTLKAHMKALAYQMISSHLFFYCFAMEMVRLLVGGQICHVSYTANYLQLLNCQPISRRVVGSCMANKSGIDTYIFKNAMTTMSSLHINMELVNTPTETS